ncbi:MAG: leucyl aminopeptidase family protein [Patulibacter sp.]|nr:leucyl aminopeptidase family protein [Patulibacter sp.]
MPDPAATLTVVPFTGGPGGDDPRVDAIVVGVTAGGLHAPPRDAPTATLARMIDAGEARAKLGHVAHTHDADGTRWVLVGLGPDGPRHDEDRRNAAGAAVAQLRAVAATSARFVLDAPDAAAPVTEAVLLAAHQPQKVGAATAEANEDPVLTAVELTAPHGEALGPAQADAVAAAAVVARAQNEARRLQQLPANLLTPLALAAEAQALGAQIDALDVTVEEGIDRLEARGMGLFAAVAKGSDEPPALIVARYEPADARGPVIGLVGKAVTHDTGGYSLKQPLGMVKMKLDMSGGAAVLQAVAAIARLGLPVRVVAVVVATENMVNGAAMKPGDVFVAANGTSVEVTNTDAEGRLVLADGMHRALELGAERLIDVATLTGGVVTALGTSHAGLMGRDESWLQLVRHAGEQSGERVWPLPLEDDHRDLMKSTAADVVNSGGRTAHPLQGAAFLERFTGDVPWAHVDMAGMFADLPRKYLAKGPSGWGVRLLVDVVRRVAD